MKPEIFDYFERAIKLGASDLILKPGAPPSYRVNKQLIISEDEAFILGNLGKYWAENSILSKNIILNDKLFYDTLSRKYF